MGVTVARHYCLYAYLGHVVLHRVKHSIFADDDHFRGRSS